MKWSWKVARVTSLPIGGGASLEEIPDKPTQELAIALAGPIVTALIALVLNLGLRAAMASGSRPSGVRRRAGAIP
jgi:hypothetical protein